MAAVDAELRRRLAARVRDFHAHGLAGIAAFDRGEGEVSAIDEDLRHSTVVSESLRRVLPAIHRALLADRLEVPGGRPVEYFWSNVSVQDRPVLLLTQRADARVGDSSAVIERRFYASWFMGAGQAIALRISVEEGTLFAYVDHSFVDRWSGPGFTTAGKRKIGLKLAGETLKKAVRRATICEGG